LKTTDNTKHINRTKDNDVSVKPTEEKYTSATSFGEDFDLDARPEQTTSSTNAIGSGWEDAEKLTAPTSEFPTEFRQSEAPQLIKFLGDGPFAAYKMHFLTQKTEGKRSYVCLDPKNSKDCPLCTLLGHKAEDKRSFTIVNFSAEGGPKRQILTATPRLFRALASANASPQGPLNKYFWSLSRSGVKQTTVYNLMPLKARDLEEDYGMHISEVESLLETMVPYTRTDIHEHTHAQLTEIANDLL